MTNPAARVALALLGIFGLATLAVVLSPYLSSGIIIVGLLVVAGLLGWVIAPPRRD